MKHVIIGGGPAALTAAKTIRAQCPKDSIEVIYRERQIHARNRLLWFLSGEKTPEQLCFVAPDFFDRYQIHQISGKEVSRLFPNEKRIQLADGGTESYDRLLIATGAQPVFPPIKGLENADRVYGFRDMEDAERILAHVKKGARAVIIGSGLVGMDAAQALLHRECHVTVVEMAGRIIPIQLDTFGSSLYEEDFRRHGARFVLNAQVKRCLTDDKGGIRAVELADGREIPCDFAVVAAGVRPRCTLAQNAVKTNRGILVDERMCTSDPYIYAAGDVTALSATFPCSMAQGKVAGENMAGKIKTYQPPFPQKNGLHYYGRMALSMGEIHPKGECSFFEKKEGDNYQRASVQNGKLLGMLLIGDISRGNAWSQIIQMKDPVPESEEIFDLVP